MKIAYTSDLHRGFSHNTDRIQHKYWAHWLEENGMPDVLMLAGDLASHVPGKQIPSLFKALRTHFTCPILAVRGNHDFWAGGHGGKHGLHKSLEKFNHEFNQACDRYNVTNLEGLVVDFYDVTFGGWLSWWHHTEVDGPAQSRQRTYEEMKRMESASFNYLMGNLPKDRKIVLMTHMPPTGGWSADPLYLDQIRTLVPDCNIITGHTHTKSESFIGFGGVRIHNAQPDYDRPKIGTLYV